MSFFKTMLGATLFVFLMGCDNQPQKKVANEVQHKIHKEDESHNEFCSNIDLMANAMMGARQSGVAMSEMMKSANEINDPELKKMSVAMVKAAYETPRFEVEENRNKAALDFRNSMYQSCIN